MSQKNRVVLYHLYFTILVIMIVICFERLVDEKDDKIKFKIIPKTDEEKNQ